MDRPIIQDLASKVKEEFSDYYEIAGGKNYRYRHLETVLKLVRNLSKNLEVGPNEKVLEISALLHDIGRTEDIQDNKMDPFEGHQGHAERGAEIVESFVAEYVTSRELDRIQKIIRNHHSEPKTVEGKILQDADKLSNFGVNNLWRQFHYASEHHLELGESIEYFWDEAVDEYMSHIEKMHFEYTKKVARERLQRQKNAFRDIEREMGGKDL